MTRSLGHNLTQRGQVNYPGITPASKRTAEDLLLTDAEKHHCFFRAAGLHNHLSHHILAAYDLGATSTHLNKIYEEEARIQRPIIFEEKDASIVVDEGNWIQYLGNASAYGAFFKFFSSQVVSLGVTSALEKYIFDNEVNKEGTLMLVRLVSGALHPFIQIGYGVEFGNDTLVATGLAQAAVHNPTAPQIFQFTYEDTARQDKGPAVLEILRQVYDSDILHAVMPYDPDALFSARVRSALEGDRPTEILRLCGQFHVDLNAGDAEFASKIEEFIWVSTLLMSATGKVGRKPRLDFFLMHLVTSSLFLSPIIRVLKNPVDKANLLRAFLPVVILITLGRGRPRINAELLMSYTAVPRPPVAASDLSKTNKSASGDPLDDADYAPWSAIIAGVLYHPDVHVVKTLRSLIFAAQHFGDTGAGAAVGAFARDGGKETHQGTGTMDGTIFVRAAGVVMDYMGWVTHGQSPRPDWDRSALGWEAAWDKDD